MCVRATVTSFITRCLGERGVRAQALVVVVVGCRCWFRRPPLAFAGPPVNRPRPSSINLIPVRGDLTQGAALEIRRGAGGGWAVRRYRRPPLALSGPPPDRGGHSHLIPVSGHFTPVLVI